MKPGGKIFCMAVLTRLPAPSAPTNKSYSTCKFFLIMTSHAKNILPCQGASEYKGFALCRLSLLVKELQLHTDGRMEEAAEQISG
jgi:hypothetical protein